MNLDGEATKTMNTFKTPYRHHQWKHPKNYNSTLGWQVVYYGCANVIVGLHVQDHCTEFFNHKSHLSISFSFESKGPCP